VNPFFAGLTLMVTAESQSHPHRFISLDMLRGLLIALMALDHANFHIAQQHSPGEYWGGSFPAYQAALPFLTRFVTHFCAPGFFFLMGAGMALFLDSRQALGWSSCRIRGHFLVRGLMLVLLQGCLNLLGIWSTPSTSQPLWYVGVLAALGAGMVFCTPFLELKPSYLAGLALLFSLVMEILTPHPEMWGRAFDHPVGVLFIYGGGKGEFWVNYPLLAWMEVILAGMVFGSWLAKEPGKAFQRAGLAGMSFLIGFVILRLVNGFGNIRPYQTGSWMDFLNLVKYPPSMTFVLLTLGVNLILLWMFSRSAQHISASWNPLIVFGKVPLFSYLAHIGVYIFLGRLITPQGSSLGVMYLFWLLGLGILYWPARWYGRYKGARPPGSWVRFF
jgi:uncharacterized membrane protein